MKKISVTDITLKKLSEDREVALLFREKTAIASCADSLGVDVVELAPVKNLREDTIVCLLHTRPFFWINSQFPTIYTAIIPILQVRKQSPAESKFPKVT